MTTNGDKPPILRVENVTRAFGGLRAVNDCSLSVQEGSITGLIGPNGAGKTTLFNLIAGLYRGTGEALFRGQPIGRLRPYQVCRRGIARTFQIPQLFQSLTVWENVRVGAHFGGGGGPGEDEAIGRAIDFVGLKDARHDPTSSLKLLDKKRTMLAAALATQPKMLLVDEPMAGLSPAEIRQALELFRRINGELGLSILIIEHFMKVLTQLSHRLMIIEGGRMICVDAPSVVVKDPRVIECYLGDSHA